MRKIFFAATKNLLLENERCKLLCVPSCYVKMTGSSSSQHLGKWLAVVNNRSSCELTAEAEAVLNVGY